MKSQVKSDSTTYAGCPPCLSKSVFHSHWKHWFLLLFQTMFFQRTTAPHPSWLESSRSENIYTQMVQFKGLVLMLNTIQAFLKSVRLFFRKDFHKPLFNIILRFEIKLWESPQVELWGLYMTTERCQPTPAGFPLDLRESPSCLWRTGTQKWNVCPSSLWRSYYRNSPFALAQHNTKWHNTL